MSIVKHIVFAGIALLGLTTVLQLSSHPAAATRSVGIAGQLAPSIHQGEWIDAKGQPVQPPRLSEHTGQTVVLYFFQDWCPGCKEVGFPNLKKMVDALADEPKVQFYAIQTVFEGSFINTPDKVRKNQRDYNLAIPMGHDEGDDDNQVPSAIRYRSGGTPWMVIIGPDRRVLFNDFNVDPDRAIPFLRRLAHKS